MREPQIKSKTEIYPQDFDEDQKISYDLFIRQGKLLFPEAEEWTIKMAVEAYVRLGTNERPKISQEEIDEWKAKYDNTTCVYETPQNLEEVLEIPESKISEVIAVAEG